MTRSVIGLAGALGMVAAAIVTPAQADWRGRAIGYGVIGGMSANQIVGAYPYGPYYPGYPAPVYHVAPLGPPPGCVIREQRVWDGYRWTSRRLRICH